ncbi:MAG: hypothetical protein CME62_15925 [Halobacteriovoraceae bacterium]|nr:hypothetical protein [Halobacteriovoraceae bacterium]
MLFCKRLSFVLAVVFVILFFVASLKASTSLKTPPIITTIASGTNLFYKGIVPWPFYSSHNGFNKIDFYIEKNQKLVKISQKPSAQHFLSVHTPITKIRIKIATLYAKLNHQETTDWLCDIYSFPRNHTIGILATLSSNRLPNDVHPDSIPLPESLTSKVTTINKNQLVARYFRCTK